MKWLAPLALLSGIGVQAFNGRATFYDAGLGACGFVSTNSDYIVALNHQQYGGGCSGTAQCGRQLRITFGSTSVVASVADCCPGCNYGDLDLTPGLFNRFANPSAGVFYMSWQWADGANNEEQRTTTTSRRTTTWQQTTTSTTSSTRTSTPTSSSVSSSAASSSVSISADRRLADNATANNLVDVNMMILQLANMLSQTVVTPKD